MVYLPAIILSLFFSIIFTLIVKKIAFRFEIIDEPNFNRKIHTMPIPLMGGLAIFLAFFLVLFIFRDSLLVGNLTNRHWLGFFIGAIFLLLGGLLDDKYNLKPKFQIIWPILAALSVVIGGVSIEKISNPMGGFISFPFWFSAIIIFLWILGMTYTTKLLDGLDGLATGVSAIGGLVIFLFTISDKYFQPDISMASLIFFCVLIGFLIFNFNPAKIFLGESGSLLIGYILGVLAIISGGKIAIALLVMGLPALDVLWTIIRRLAIGKNPFKYSDRKHLHYRLIDLGFSHKKAVLFFYIISAFFGFGSLFLQSSGKLWALFVLLILMLTIIIFFHFFDKKKNNKETLLLHICCAPCGSYLISKILSKKFDVILYFYNSNIDTWEEYDRRLFWIKHIAGRYNLELKIEPYNHSSWLEKVHGLEQEPEKGNRCFVCYKDRLFKTAQLAKKLGIKNFYTTLTVSPYKDLDKIREYGEEIAEKENLKFIDLKFDRKEVYEKSIELAKKLGIYRQKYCACEFSRPIKINKEKNEQ